jgi:hypothetical protein
MPSNAVDGGLTKSTVTPGLWHFGLKELAVNEKIREIIEGFLPAMARIQATNQSDEQKKRNSKEWLRSKLVSLAAECEKSKGAKTPPL